MHKMKHATANYLGLLSLEGYVIPDKIHVTHVESTICKIFIATHLELILSTSDQTASLGSLMPQ